MEEEVVKPFVGKTFSLTGNMDRDSLIAQIKAAGGQVWPTAAPSGNICICTRLIIVRNNITHSLQLSNQACEVLHVLAEQLSKFCRLYLVNFVVSGPRLARLRVLLRPRQWVRILTPHVIYMCIFFIT